MHRSDDPSRPSGARRIRAGGRVLARSASSGLRPFLLAAAALVPPLMTIPVAARSAAAQERTVRERMIPIDSTRSIEEIGPELRRELGLFSDIEGFRAARLFELGDGGTVLEITFRQDGQLMRERRYLTPQVLASLRNHLAERLAEVGPDRPVAGAEEERVAEAPPDETPEEAAGADEEQAVTPLDQEGRGRLVLGETLVGLGFYGWAVPEILDLEGERPAVAAYLLTAGASFFLPYRLTRSVPVTDAHRHMALWGATRGVLYGYLGASAVTADEDFGRRGHLASALGTSVAASYLGYRSVEWGGGLDEGAGLVWTTLADAGTLAGFGAAYVAGFYDDVLVERQVDDPLPGEPRTVVESEQAHPRAADLTALALTGAGLAAGRWLGTTDDYTPGDVSALRSAALLGAQAALPLAELTVGADDDRGKRYVAGMMAGGVAGIAAGSTVLRGRSFSSSEGLLLNAGHVAGGLAALGVTWLLTPDGDGDELLYTTTSAVGSAVGLALTFRALGADDDREAGVGGARGAGSAGSAGSDRRIRVQLTPAALLAGLLGEGAGPGRGPVVPPLLRVRF